MSRYIDADLLKAEFTGDFTKAYATSLIKRIIDQQPTANVQEVKHAKWMHYGEYAQCSNCEHVTEDYYIDGDSESGYYTVLPHYCSNCGAKMNLEDNK